MKYCKVWIRSIASVIHFDTEVDSMSNERKVVTIHQPEAFPWLGFFNKMIMADFYVILDNVQFRKNYFQNRNRILTKHGPEYLTIPVDFKNHKTIKDIRVINDQNWRRKHLNTIKYTYSKAPYFQNHIGFFEELYGSGDELLIDFNMRVIEYIRYVLSIDTPTCLASDLDVCGSATELLFEICKKCGAAHYLSGRDGINYLDLSLFEEAGITVVFQSFTHPEYNQFNNSKFEPFISTFDLLFNHTAEEARKIIESGDTLDEKLKS